jgi:hypothetical protein
MQNVSLWKIIQAQQVQLNRIQDQIDRVIVACGGVLPGTYADRMRLDFPVRCEPGRVIAIESAPAALALRYDSDTPCEDYSSDDESLVSPEVAKLVQKYSI